MRWSKNSKQKKKKQKAEAEAKRAEAKIKNVETEKQKAEEIIKEMLVMQLRMKFKYISKEYEEKILNLSMEKIEQIRTIVLEIDKMEEIEAYL